MQYQEMYKLPLPATTTNKNDVSSPPPQIPVQRTMANVHQKNLPSLPTGKNRLLQATSSKRGSGSTHSRSGSRQRSKSGDGGENPAIPTGRMGPDSERGTEESEGTSSDSGTSETSSSPTESHSNSRSRAPNWIANVKNRLTSAAASPSSILQQQQQQPSNGNPADYLFNQQGSILQTAEADSSSILKSIQQQQPADTTTTASTYVCPGRKRVEDKVNSSGRPSPLSSRPSPIGAPSTKPRWHSGLKVKVVDPAGTTAKKDLQFIDDPQRRSASSNEVCFRVS